MRKQKQRPGATAASRMHVLADVVAVKGHFMRSVRVDADLGREDALQGYICQLTARTALESIARQVAGSQQRAFTVTGPYGGGKSSLALLLGALVGRDAKLRELARSLVGAHGHDGDVIEGAFRASGHGWSVVPVVGSRSSVVESLAQSSETHAGVRDRKRTSASVIAGLVAKAEQRRSQGVLVLIDELGKFLEAAARGGDDIHFFQELAEAASRCRGKLVVVGILHQAFEAYATRLSRDSRDEWAKVQGRYVDIPLVSTTDEVVELIGRAIEVRDRALCAPAMPVAARVAEAIRKRRPGMAPSLAQSLANCWPVSPVTAALLGPMSKRRFGQNERSAFSFLASREPLGFVEFLEGFRAEWFVMYPPWRFWDYLRTNFEPAILASSDGHRWATAVEAVERAEAKGKEPHVRLAKTIAVIELFRNGSGLVAELDVLQAALPDQPEDSLKAALAELEAWSIVVFRKHLEGYGVYAGSDFDIEGAAERARGELVGIDIKRLVDLVELRPVLAKRLYHQTGTMRWFSRSLAHMDEAERYVQAFRPVAGAVGEFVLVFPRAETRADDALAKAKEVSRLDGDGPVVVGVPSEGQRIAELGLSFAALERVRNTSPEIDGDSVARREIDARISAVRADLEEELRNAFDTATWFSRGKRLGASLVSLSNLASTVADTEFPLAPNIRSELLNREQPSSNSVKARRDLMQRMRSHATQEDLGYEGFPADAGLYHTLVRRYGLHRKSRQGSWGFEPPDLSDAGRSLAPMWNTAIEQLKGAAGTVTLDDIYGTWSARPYGARAGVLPVLALAFYLANSTNLAMYIRGTFQPELTEADIDEWLQDPTLVTFRWVDLKARGATVLQGLADALSARLRSPVGSEPLDVARALVAVVRGLPKWAMRTSTISRAAQDVRQMVMKASDPHRLLFSDLPALLELKDERAIVSKLGSLIAELTDAYPAMLASVEQRLFEALDHDGDQENLRRRGATVNGISGDFRVDAFATRLAEYEKTASIEGLIALAVNKPPAEWVDRDVDAGVIQLAAWSIDFRRVEAFAKLRNRPATRRAMAVIFGSGDGHDISRSFDVAESDRGLIDNLVKSFLVAARGQKPEVLFAAFVEAGSRIAEQSSAGR